MTGAPCFSFLAQIRSLLNFFGGVTKEIMTCIGAVCCLDRHIHFEYIDRIRESIF